MQKFFKEIIFFVALVTGNVLGAQRLAENFVSYYQNGMRYSLLPVVKELIAEDPTQTKGLSNALEEIILLTGSRNIQGFSIEQLQKHKLDVIDYVIGRKYFQKGSWVEAENYFNKVSAQSKFYPMAQQALGTVSALQNKGEKAQLYFSQCHKNAKKLQVASEGQIQLQYKAIGDQCLIGRSRVIYALKKYPEADRSYMDVEKKNYLWPTILVEEAWSSYQQKSYNRALGKTTTYKAPQLRYAYQPEVDVVRAMSFLEMCLYDDTQETVNSFYQLYEPLAKYLEGTLQRYGRDANYYYQLLQQVKTNPGPFHDFLTGVTKELDVHLLMTNINSSKSERAEIINKFQGQAESFLLANLDEYQDSQKELLGYLARTKVRKFSVDLRIALQQMSYIKLEVLGRKKKAIYQGKAINAKRGDVQYLKKTRAQYFWNYRGEFWADELGDYVFALASECPQSAGRAQ